MKNALINLLKIKSLTTIAIIIVFVVLALSGNLSDELVASIITAVITYYFTKRDTTKEG